MSLTMPSREFLVRQAVLNTVSPSALAYVSWGGTYISPTFHEWVASEFEKLTSHYGEGELRT